MVRLPLCFLIVLLMVIPVRAGEIVLQKNLAVPEIAFSKGYHHFISAPGPIYGLPGNPEMPYSGQRILLPPGEEIIEVYLEGEVWQSVPGSFQLQPAQPPIPYSQEEIPLATAPNPLVYTSNEFFPEEPIQTIRTDFLCGHGIGTVTIVTSRYQPASGHVEHLISYNLHIITAPTTRAFNSYSSLLKKTPKVNERLSRNVLNPEAISSYGGMDDVDEVSVKYLIITAEELEPFFRPLADYRSSRGLQAHIVLVEDIETQYYGIDLQDKIRNCVIDYYQTEALEYVLLAGDNEYVPKRGFFAQIGGTVDEDIPADLYYSNLDGNWNNDGDNRWGESGEEDLNSEVAVGRIAVDSDAEAQNLINKTIMYENSPVAGDLEQALMLGEDLGWNVWGGEYKEEIRLGSSMWGYTTAGFPSNFAVDVMYDMYGTWSSVLDLIPRLNAGLQMVNHLGHSNVTYCMKINHTGVNDQTITNNGINHNFYILYSQGCYDGSFDNRTDGGSYVIDCIAEDFTVIQNGAVAFLCNSRYGWGSTNSTNGPSQYYDRQFFDAIFAEEIYNLGWINADSKEDNNPYINQGATHWVYYEMNLLGDPAIEVWTASPQGFSPSYPDQFTLGTTQFSVNAEIEGAQVCLSLDGIILGQGVTGGSGTAIVQLEEPLSASGEMQICFTKHNYLPYQGTIYAVPTSGPYILMNDWSFDDTVSGNGDGNADLGEKLQINASFINAGMDPASGLEATLECDEICVDVLTGAASIGDLEVMQTIYLEGAFEVELLPTVDDGQVLPFTITVEDGMGSIWVEEFAITALAPILQLTNFSVNDGNDGWLVPGETATLDLEILNAGSSSTSELTVWIYADHPQVIIPANSITRDPLTPGASDSISGLEFTVDETMPDPTALVLYITAADSRSYQADFLIEVPVGGAFDNMESGIGDWTHGNITPGYGDQWSLDTLLNHTEGGSYSWYCGNIGQYAPSLDAGLVTPVYNINGNNELRFFQWMCAEIPMQSQYYGYAHDGGIVEASINGSGFEQVTPRGGYPFLIRYNTTLSPFAEGTPCFSGQILWEEAIFDISGEGTVQFRFRFGSNGTISSIGWCIDDLQLNKMSDENPPQNLEASVDGPEITLTWNTPGIVDPIGKGSGSNRQPQSLEYYRIYRDGMYIDSVQSLIYVDIIVSPVNQLISYQISGVFGGIEGPLCQPVQVDVLGIELDEEAALPRETTLKSAFPNPFNSTLNLNFDLATRELVRITAYDLLGRKAAEIYHGWLDTGQHQVRWEASGLASGVYIIRLETSNYQGLRKALLLK